MLASHPVDRAQWRALVATFRLAAGCGNGVIGLGLPAALPLMLTLMVMPAGQRLTAKIATRLFRRCVCIGLFLLGLHLTVRF